MAYCFSVKHCCLEFEILSGGDGRTVMWRWRKGGGKGKERRTSHPRRKTCSMVSCIVRHSLVGFLGVSNISYCYLSMNPAVLEKDRPAGSAEAFAAATRKSVPNIEGSCILDFNSPCEQLYEVN